METRSAKSGDGVNEGARPSGIFIVGACEGKLGVVGGWVEISNADRIEEEVTLRRGRLRARSFVSQSEPTVGGRRGEVEDDDTEGREVWVSSSSASL